MEYIRKYSKKEEAQLRAIVKDIVKRAESGEFGWVTGRAGWASEQEREEYMKTAKPHILPKED